MTKFSETQTVRVRDPKNDRDADLIPTREEVEQSRKLVEEVRQERSDKVKRDKNH